MPGKAPRRRPDWSESIEVFRWVQGILRLHAELPFFVIRWDGKKGLLWRDLNGPAQHIQPYQFEIFFGKEAVRDEYYLRMFRQVAKSRQCALGTLHGFWDLFYPIRSDPERRTFIYVGQFCREPPDWQMIARSWRELTGQEAASANPDFARFARMVLTLPVVPEAVLRDIDGFLELFTEFLTGSHEKLEEPARLDRLRLEVFVDGWPNHDWVQQAVSSEKFLLTPWALEGQLSEWMRQEMHITRLPTTAMALMPLNSGLEPLDPLRAMIQTHRVQLACMDHVVDMPHTGASKLQDYGVLFLTSADPSKSATRARTELRERARELQAFVRERFGLESVVGIGRSLPPGEPLHPSYHEAVMALHLCVQFDQNILFYEDKYGDKERLPYAELHEASLLLADAFGRGRVEEIKLAADQYVRLALLYSGERIEVIRSQFLSMLFQLIRSLQKRHQIRRQAAAEFSASVTQRLECAATSYHVIECFKEALDRVAFFSTQALEGPKSLRLYSTLEYLKSNFSDSLSLPDVARRSGFSVPAFSRIFKQATGTSYLSYVRAIRIEHAKKLLRTTALSTEQVAQASGFRSQHHLIRSFRKVCGVTPGRYRQDVTEKKKRPEPSNSLRPERS